MSATPPFDLLADEAERVCVPLLREAGCGCPKPLLGWRPHVGPRCRLCNAVANAKNPPPGR